VTVYVDQVRIPASVGRYQNRVWCHLLTDDPTMAELHAFAARIGLRRSWFQETKTLGPHGQTAWWRNHYDVTEAIRERALAAGAIEIDFEEWAVLTERFKAMGERW